VNYHPEQVGIAPYNTGLCEYLAKAGHEVDMLTAFAYYPAWKKADADRHRLYGTEEEAGVRIRRCWNYVPARPSGLGRIVHEASFVVTSALQALFMRRADVMVVVSPPLLLGAAAWLVGRIKGTPHVLHVQDLQPDAALGLGMLKHSWLTGLLRRLELFNYRKAARVSVISEGMFRALKWRGIKRLVYFPNWIIRKQKDAETNGAPAGKKKEFVILYSGNIGVKQGLDTVVEAAARVKEVRLIICGDGAARPALEKLVNALKAKNVTLLPLQPEAEYRRMVSDADVCVISQRVGGGVAFFPSKLLSSVAQGKPVLAVAEGGSELVRVVREEGLGSWVTPEVNAVAEAMRTLKGSGPQLEEWGRNGRGFAAKFEEEPVLRRFERVLREVAEG
jgi:colanic acid biosynthesis glycosyl transferase WcaI